MVEKYEDSSEDSLQELYCELTACIQTCIDIKPANNYLSLKIVRIILEGGGASKEVFGSDTQLNYDHLSRLEYKLFSSHTTQKVFTLKHSVASWLILASITVNVSSCCCFSMYNSDKENKVCDLLSASEMRYFYRTNISGFVKNYYSIILDLK